jgi:hypothetical protein
MSNVYVVEYASEEWGEHPDWKSVELTDLNEANQRALAFLWIGNAVRMYTKEKSNEEA